MSVLADNAAADVRDTDIREHVVVRVADEVVIDLMGRACGLSYTEVAADAEQQQLGDALVPVVLTLGGHPKPAINPSSRWAARWQHPVEWPSIGRDETCRARAREANRL